MATAKVIRMGSRAIKSPVRDRVDAALAPTVGRGRRSWESSLGDESLRCPAWNTLRSWHLRRRPRSPSRRRPCSEIIRLRHQLAAALELMDAAVVAEINRKDFQKMGLDEKPMLFLRIPQRERVGPFEPVRNGGRAVAGTPGSQDRAWNRGRRTRPPVGSAPRGAGFDQAEPSRPFGAVGRHLRADQPLLRDGGRQKRPWSGKAPPVSSGVTPATGISTGRCPPADAAARESVAGGVWPPPAEGGEQRRRILRGSCPRTMLPDEGWRDVERWIQARFIETRRMRSEGQRP